MSIFSGQLHPACDAMFYIQNTSTAVPFQMRQVEENISFLEYTSPFHLENPSLNDQYTTNPSTVYVTKKQLEVVEYITKFTGQFIHNLMNIPCLFSLLTAHFF